MRFLSSSSSSASSTTTTTTSSYGKTRNTRNPTARRLAGMIRKILCFSSLPRHPSDQFKDAELNSVEPNKLEFFGTEEKIGATANPGIVARLMGLESMPRIDSANSISRSQSMNYDSWRESESMHRLVNTSLSFRELPTFLELENKEFFVLSFEKSGENEQFGSEANRSEMGYGNLMGRRGEKCKSKSGEKENQEPKNAASNEKINRRINQKPSQKPIKHSKPRNHRENSNGGKQRKEKEESVSASKKVETECDSEISSPVSILDLIESIAVPQISISEEEAKLTRLKSRKKLSADFGNYPPSPCKPNMNATADVERRKLIDKKRSGSRKKDHRRRNVMKMIEEAVDSNWVCGELRNVDDFEGIGVEFGLQILETMLNELVDQLIETSHGIILICNN